MRDSQVPNIFFERWPLCFYCFFSWLFLFSILFILRRIGAYATTKRLKINLYVELHCV